MLREENGRRPFAPCQSGKNAAPICTGMKGRRIPPESFYSVFPALWLSLVKKRRAPKAEELKHPYGKRGEQDDLLF